MADNWNDEDLWDEPSPPPGGGNGKRTAGSRTGGVQILLICLAAAAAVFSVCLIISGRDSSLKDAVVAGVYRALVEADPSLAGPSDTDPGDGTGGFFSALTGAVQTPKPAAVPTRVPIAVPTKAPTAVPTKVPTAVPTSVPTAAPVRASAEWYDWDLLYYYRQLTEKEKDLFVLLHNGISAFETSVDISGRGFTESEYERVVYAMQMDCPELFQWRGIGTLWSYDSSRLTSVEPVYRMSESEYRSKASRIHAVTASLKAETAGYRDEYDVEKAVYCWLIDNCYYLVLNDPTAHADAALCDGRAQCAGYARALQLMLRNLGIECVYVCSIPEGDHSWIKAKINGNWYNVDVTWDDGEDPARKCRHMPGQNEFFCHLNIPDRMMLCDSHTPETRAGFPLPSCVSIEDNYVYREGIYIPSGTSDVSGAVQNKILSAISAGRTKMMIMTDGTGTAKDAGKLLDGLGYSYSYMAPGKTETRSFYLEIIK